MENTINTNIGLLKVRLPDGNTNFFGFVEEILQGYTLAPYLFIVHRG